MKGEAYLVSQHRVRHLQEASVLRQEGSLLLLVWLEVAV